MSIDTTRSHEESFDPEFVEIERAILASGQYVHPSDDLRPRTIEAAREVCRDQRMLRSAGVGAIAALVLALLSSPVVERLNHRHSRSLSPTAREIEQQAMELSMRAGIGPEWALSEAFNALRKDQAARFGRRSF